MTSVPLHDKKMGFTCPEYSSALPQRGAGGSPHGDYSAPPTPLVREKPATCAESQKKDILSGETQGSKHHPFSEGPVLLLS